MKMVKMAKNMSQQARNSEFQEVASQKFSQNFTALEMFWFNLNVVALESCSTGWYGN